MIVITGSFYFKFEIVMFNRMYILPWHSEQDNLTAYTDN